jgi:hypothetical protein
MMVFGIIQGVPNVWGSGALTPSPVAQRPKEALSVSTLSPKQPRSKFERSAPGQVETVCGSCDRLLFVYPSQLKRRPNAFCNRSCLLAYQRTLTGDKSGNWQGGTTVSSGRVRVYMPTHPRANSNGYVYRYWRVAEQMLGRSLRPGEEVHHRNEDKSDDSPGNLIITESRREHLTRYHGANGEWSKDFAACTECGRSDRPYAGYGVCLACYKRERRAAKRENRPPRWEGS